MRITLPSSPRASWRFMSLIDFFIIIIILSR